MRLEHLREGAPEERTLLYRFMQFMTVAVVFLLLAGAAVKSTDNGLAVPDWPLSFGQVMPEMKGGVFYEHGHRMVATGVGFLTIILAVWFWMRDPRPQLRRLGWIALVMVIVLATGVLAVASLAAAAFPRSAATRSSILLPALLVTFFVPVVPLAAHLSGVWIELPLLDRSAGASAAQPERPAEVRERPADSAPLARNNESTVPPDAFVSPAEPEQRGVDTEGIELVQGAWSSGAADSDQRKVVLMVGGESRP